MQLSVKPKADLSHNPFDTASRDVFSLKTGMITPCLVRHTIPDSMYDCRLKSLTRTIPVQNAPFARMSQNFEYYFVPYSQIFHDFERIYYERGEEQRNVTGQEQIAHATQLPCFILKDVLENLFTSYCLSRFRLDIDLKIAEKTDSGSMIGMNLLLAASHHDYQSEFKDIHGRSCAEDMLRLFDMLGYGNYLPLFKSLYILSFAELEADGYTSCESYIQAIRDNDFTGINNLVNIVDDLGQAMVTTSAYSDMIQNFPNVKPNIFALAAYVKVWSDFYRNTQYDVNQNYSYLFNFDYIVDDANIIVPAGTVCRMLIPRYRQYKKDMFTGGYPSAQFGSVAVANLENPSTILNTASFPSSGRTSLFAGVNANSNNLNLRNSANNNIEVPGSTNWQINSSISAIAVRQSLALQRYKERILRAGNRTRSLQSAVFGDKSRYIEDMYVDFLGSEQSVINFNSVAATNTSDRNELGELGSNGVSSADGKVFKYHSHDFGVIIGMTYILPESEYEAYMVDYFNTTSESWDFYKPDFMNIGLQEVYNYHFNIFPDYNESYEMVVLNYLSRYWPYKVAVDKVHGEFYSSLPFTLPYMLDDYLARQSLYSVSVGSFAEMVTPRKSNSLRELVLPSLYVNPTDVDRIFYQISDSTQASDQFKCVVYHDFKSVLPMSVVGLPSL